jgi:hypothetical protein
MESESCVKEDKKPKQHYCTTVLSSKIPDKGKCTSHMHVASITVVLEC